jgi:thiamine transport system ATP-binding protein
MLRVTDASVRFGEHLALAGVDLEVARGEVVAVVGPSGSGKSTLLRAVAGLQPLASGAVSLDGRDLGGVPPHRRGIGLMFQQPALFPHRDVAGNIGFGLRQQGRRGRAVEEAVTSLLELVGLPGFERRPVGELSGGEQQRVALARALAPAPALLLLDEPMGALDRALRERLVHDLRVVIDRLGLTVIAVTHDQAEAFTLADRIVVLEDGRVRQVGTAEQLWSAPADVAVADLLGLGATVTVVVTDGVAATPWGPVVVGGPDGPTTLLVRPSGLVIDPSGPAAAHVRSVRFRGAVTVLELEVPSAPVVRTEVATDGAPARGSTVQVRLDGRGVGRLSG